MKKIKKLGIMAVSVALLTTALAVPASATSVSGSVGGYSCSGSNSIYASGASANTHCSGNAALGVTLHYCMCLIKVQMDWSEMLVQIVQKPAEIRVQTIVIQYIE